MLSQRPDQPEPTMRTRRAPRRVSVLVLAALLAQSSIAQKSFAQSSTAPSEAKPASELAPRPLDLHVLDHPATLDGADDISPLLAQVADGKEYPCVAAVVVKQGRIIARGAAGVRRIGDPTKATAYDLFHLGSCTKAMTATLCAMLVEEGKLRWDSTIGEIFPELKPLMVGAWPDITLRQLVTHSSGIGSDLRKKGLWEMLWNHQGLPDEARMDMLRTIVAWDLQSEPGTAYCYSNTNFIIAGMMAERVTGVLYETLITQRLFEPLGMTTAMFGPPGSADKVDQPWGTNRAGESIAPSRTADNPPMLSPAGRASMSLDDWAKFVTLHLEGERGGSTTLLKPESFVLLHTPALNNYAAGWGRSRRAWAGPQGVTLSHSGSNTMWYAVTWLAPEKDMAVLVATNSAHAGVTKVCDSVVSGLISKYVASAPAIGASDQRGAGSVPAP